MFGLIPLLRARIIDANTGKEVQVGETFENVDGKVTIHKVDIGIFSGRALVSIKGTHLPKTIECRHFETGELKELPNPHHRDIDRQWMPLAIRYTHPSFPFQKIAFIPS